MFHSLVMCGTYTTNRTNVHSPMLQSVFSSLILPCLSLVCKDENTSEMTLRDTYQSALHFRLEVGCSCYMLQKPTSESFQSSSMAFFLLLFFLTSTRRSLISWRNRAGKRSEFGAPME